MRLFRYLDAEAGLATLREGALKITRPNQFNDPFEYLLRVRAGRRLFRKCFLQLPEMKTVIKKRVVALLQEADHIKPSLSQVRATELKVKEELRNEFYTNWETIAEKRIRNRLEILSRTTGVTCFTTEKNHPLMWSHYADGHKGMVIEIETETAFPQPPKIIDIKYVDEPPEYDVFDGNLLNTQTGRNHYIDTILGRKSTIWKYEKEQRIQFDIAILKHTTTPQGEELLLFEIPKTAIKSVILGCRFPRSWISDFKKITAHHDYSLLSCYAATSSTRDYKLIYNAIK